MSSFELLFYLEHIELKKIIRLNLWMYCGKKLLVQ